MSKKYNIIRNGRSFGEFEVLKSCCTSLGYQIFLFGACTTNPRLMRYIVTVRKGDETIEFKPMFRQQNPFSMYLDFICCYA